MRDNFNANKFTKSLYIEHISAHKASQPWHSGRQRRSRMKRAHIQVVLKEVTKKEVTKEKVAKEKVVSKDDKK